MRNTAKSTLSSKRRALRTEICGKFSTVGYVLTDRNGRIMEINQAGQIFFGRTRKRLLKRPLSSLVAPENQTIVQNLLERALDIGFTEKQEIEISRPDESDHCH